MAACAAALRIDGEVCLASVGRIQIAVAVTRRACDLAVSGADTPGHGVAVADFARLDYAISAARVIAEASRQTEAASRRQGLQQKQ
jgi:hypothetical protein